MAVDVEPLRGRPDRPSGPIGLRRWHVAVPRIIERAAVREILMGAQDNLTNVLAVMLGVSIGSGRSDLVALACISSAVAEAVSMGGVLYSSTRAGNNHERRVHGDQPKSSEAYPEPIGAYDVRRRADRWPRPTGSSAVLPLTSGGRRFRRDFHRCTVRPRVLDGEDQRRGVVARRSPLVTGRRHRGVRRGSVGTTLGRLGSRSSLPVRTAVGYLAADLDLDVLRLDLLGLWQRDREQAVIERRRCRLRLDCRRNGERPAERPAAELLWT